VGKMETKKLGGSTKKGPQLHVSPQAGGTKQAVVWGWVLAETGIGEQMGKNKTKKKGGGGGGGARGHGRVRKKRQKTTTRVPAVKPRANFMKPDKKHWGGGDKKGERQRR